MAVQRLHPSAATFHSVLESRISAREKQTDRGEGPPESPRGPLKEKGHWQLEGGRETEVGVKWEAGREEQSGGRGDKRGLWEQRGREGCCGVPGACRTTVEPRYWVWNPATEVPQCQQGSGTMPLPHHWLPRSPPSLPPPASLPQGRSCFPAKSKAFISSFQSWE